MNQELINRAKAAKSPDELSKMAHENGMEDFTEESAKAYYDLLHKSGELSDDELDSAAGGGCHKGNYLVVSRGNVCSLRSILIDNTEPAFYNWKCKTCKEQPGRGGVYHEKLGEMVGNFGKNCSCHRPTLNVIEYMFGVSGNFNAVGVCGSCDYCKYENGLWLCTF